LQVSSFKEREEAVEFLKTLKEAGHPCFIVSVDVPERGRIYRVRVGPFSNVKEAREYQKEFEQKEGMLTFLVRRRLP
jgi:cell division septation protein DedD